MEDQIDFLSSSDIDNLVMSSNNPFNSLSIVLPYDYAKNKLCLNWKIISLGVEMKYFDKKVVMDFASEQLLYESNQSLIYLICENDNIIDNTTLKDIQILADSANDTKENAKNKLLYLVLSYLYDNRNRIEDFLCVVDIVYDDFRFPKIISKQIDYLHNINDCNLYEAFSNMLNYIKDNL